PQKGAGGTGQEPWVLQNLVNRAANQPARYHLHLALLLLQKVPSRCGSEFAIIIYLLAPKKSRLNHSLKYLALVRRQLVAMMDHFRLDEKAPLRTPEHYVCIATDSNSAFPCA